MPPTPETPAERVQSEVWDLPDLTLDEDQAAVLDAGPRHPEAFVAPPRRPRQVPERVQGEAGEVAE